MSIAAKPTHWKPGGIAINPNRNAALETDCIVACAGGRGAREQFCRNIKNATLRAGCWAMVHRPAITEQQCGNWCHEAFGDW